MLRSISVYVIIIAAFLTLTLFSSSTDEQSVKKTNNVENDALIPQTVKSIPIDKDFTFAGEEVPTQNFDVYERLDRELLRNAYYHSSTILSLKRAKRYFPGIEKILAENEIPEEEALSLEKSFAPLFAQAKEWKKKAEAINVTSLDQEKEMQEAREARLAPDKKKFEELALAITRIEMPEVKSDDAKKVISGVVNLLNKTSNYIKTTIINL